MKHFKGILSICVVLFSFAGAYAQTARQTVSKATKPIANLYVSKAGTTISAGSAVKRAVAKSNVVRKTALKSNILYFEDFLSKESLDSFTIVNVNGDRRTWGYSAWDHCAVSNYSSTYGTDDWLITPGIRLQAGKYYKASFRAKASGANSEGFKVEAKLGNDTTIESLTQEIIPFYTLSGANNYTVLEKTFQVESDGVYHLGIHDNSDKGDFIMGVKLDSIQIELASYPQAPDSVTNLRFKAGDKGTKVASLTFNAPSVSIDGNKLTDVIDSIQVQRNGSYIGSMTNLQPGAEATFTDSAVPTMGDNTYTLIPYNRYGFGTEQSITGYVGEDMPQAPTNVRAIDGVSNVILSWDKLSYTGANGGYVNADSVLYRIYDTIHFGYPVPLDSVKGDTAYVIPRNTDLAEQFYFDMGLAAENAIGSSEIVYSSPIVIGEAYKLPFHDSFALENNSLAHMWWTAGNNRGNFQYTSDAGDDEGGYMALVPRFSGVTASINTGKLDISGAASPLLSYSYLATPATDIKLNVEAILPDGNIAPIDSVNFNTLDGETGWRSRTVDLTSLKQGNRYILIRFEAVANARRIPIGIDNVNVVDAHDADLAASIVLPSKVQKSGTCTVTARVFNYGTKPANHFKITFFDGEEEIGDTVITTELPSFTAARYNMAYRPSVLKEGSEATLSVKVDIDGDANLADNVAFGTLQLTDPQYPSASGLTAESSNGNVVLNWKAPASNAITVTDNFDDYEPWLIDNFGGWRTVDRDSLPTGTFMSDASFPHLREPYAYIVFNPDALSPGLSQEDYIAPHSGGQFLASMLSYDEMGNYRADDWLISPELSGNKQTINFFVRDLWATGESFELLYSTTGTDLADFTKIGETDTIQSGVWEPRDYEIPEGAKYFAIHHNTVNTNYCFMIDDVTYEGTCGDLLGYNIYRDGQLIATVKEPTYSDAGAASSNHDYSVTAVFASGESLPISTSVTTGIRTLQQSAARYDIYNVNGMKVGDQTTPLSSLPHGVYIVNGKKYMR